MPTPSFALEVQRGSIPGAPKATVFSGEFIFYVPRSERQRLICAAMFSADGAPIARVILWILFIRVIRVVRGRLLSFFVHIRGFILAAA